MWCENMFYFPSPPFLLPSPPSSPTPPLPPSPPLPTPPVPPLPSPSFLLPLLPCYPPLSSPQHTANNGITNTVITLKDIASITLANNLTFQFIDNETVTTVWPTGVPQDGTPIVTENFPVLPLTIVCYCFASASTLFAVGCMVFNFIFRQRK